MRGRRKALEKMNLRRNLRVQGRLISMALCSTYASWEQTLRLLSRPKRTLRRPWTTCRTWKQANQLRLLLKPRLRRPSKKRRKRKEKKEAVVDPAPAKEHLPRRRNGETTEATKATEKAVDVPAAPDANQPAASSDEPIHRVRL